jgi:hypothetical protein
MMERFDFTAATAIRAIAWHLCVRITTILAGAEQVLCQTRQYASVLVDAIVELVPALTVPVARFTCCHILASFMLEYIKRSETGQLEMLTSNTRSHRP